ncbi:MAG: alpha/beta hydrolase [Burkholderiaceae bacterium]
MTDPCVEAAAAPPPEPSRSSDESGLALYDFPAAGPPRGSLYLLHGFGEHVGRYRRLIALLNAQGWHVGAHDHRGHGHSPGVRGRLPGEPGFIDDALRRFDAFRRHTGVEPVLFGHSMGGTLAAEMVLQHECRVAGLVLSSPALRPSLSAFQRFQVTIVNAIAPNLVMTRPIDGRRLSHDPEQVRAYHDDPLVHGSVTAALVDWMLQSGARSIAAAGTLLPPTLLLGGSDDRVADPQAWHAFAVRAPTTRLRFVLLDGGLHELFNETAHWRERADAELGGWLTALASGATTISAGASADTQARAGGVAPALRPAS